MPMSTSRSLDASVRNRRLALGLAGVGAAMLVAAFSAPALYGPLTEMTGFGGAVHKASAEADAQPAIAREMTVSFDANVDKALPWRIVAAKPVNGRIGTLQQAVFTATNVSDHPTTARAVFNVSPQLAGKYFIKVKCFCSQPETLKPGETASLPVSFFVNPAIAENDDLHTVRDITLSYTFYADDLKGS
jgi:cytochrome c oxidase assembly protein subunit 11